METLGEPIVIISGDANKKLTAAAFADFPEIVKINAGPSRGDSSLIECHTNILDCILETFISAPLQSEEGVDSDHRVVVCKADMPKRDSFKKTTFSYRPYTAAGEERFGRMLMTTDWKCIMSGSSSDAACAFADILSLYTDLCFPDKEEDGKKHGSSLDNGTLPAEGQTKKTLL